MQKKYKKTLYACCTGYVVQSVIVNLPALLFAVFQEKFKISFVMLGNLILLNFSTQLITDIASIYLCKRLGTRKSVYLSHILAATGLVFLGVLPFVMNPYSGLCIATVTYAVGGGLIEVLLSPMVDAIPSDTKTSDMSFLHSFYSWGQVAVILLTTLTLFVIGKDKWFILPMLWAFLPIWNLMRFKNVTIFEISHKEEKISLTKLFKSKAFLGIILLMICAGASEQVMAQWSSLFAEKGLMLPKALGDVLGPCIFAAMMGIGRSVHAKYGEKIKLSMALMSCGILGFFAYLISAVVPVAAISLAGCALCGLAVSIMWPGMFSFSAEVYPEGGSAMFGFIAFAGDVGCSCGPWLTGYISEITESSAAIQNVLSSCGISSGFFGLHAGLCSAIIFPLLMILGVALLSK